MQFVRATSTAALFLLFGTIVPGYAQQNQQNEKQGKPEKQQGRQQQEKEKPQQQQHAQRGQQQQSQPQRGQPAQQRQEQRVQQTQQQRPQQQEQRPQQARQQEQPHRTEQQATAWQQQRGWVQQGAWREYSTWQQGRARSWESEHRTWVQRGGYGGYYIPQARFSISFGNQHWFRMHSRPTMYMGYPRFSYNGFSFLLVDPWPEYWADNWYDTDDVYIDYDDGYYLYSRRHPSVRLAITVVL